MRKIEIFDRYLIKESNEGLLSKKIILSDDRIEVIDISLFDVKYTKKI